MDRLDGHVALITGAVRGIGYAIPTRVVIEEAPAFCASKVGLLQPTRATALDHANEGIRVNALSPGTVRTERLADLYGSRRPPPNSFPRLIRSGASRGQRKSQPPPRFWPVTTPAS